MLVVPKWTISATRHHLFNTKTSSPGYAIIALHCSGNYKLGWDSQGGGYFAYTADGGQIEEEWSNRVLKQNYKLQLL